MLRYIFFCALFLGFLSCDNNKNTPPPPPPPPEEQKPAVTGTALPYPFLPDEIRQDLFDRCDFVDYIFYDPSLPMSISLNEVGSIRSTLNHFSREPAISNGTCKPMGRILYQSQGEFIIEADFYLVEGCTYFVFMVDQKPTYANAMAQGGIDFFTNNIKYAKASVLQKQQQQ